MGSPGKYFRQFFREADLRQHVWARFVHHKNIYAKGQGEIGFLASAVFGFQGIMVACLFLRDFIPGLPRWVFLVVVPMMLMGKIILFYAIGYFWDKEKIFKHEKSWQNHRDPMAECISKKLLHGTGLEVK